MNTHPSPPDQPIHDELHPLVYRAMVGLTIWLVLSVWLLFSRGPDVELNLLVITVFFLIAMAIPLLIALTWSRNATPDEVGTETKRFREWKTCEFTTWTGRVSGTEAAMQILLPIAAVAIGMTIFGLVFYLDVPHLG